MKPHLCHIFPAFATGGPEVRTALLINALEGLFQHTIISLNGDITGRARICRPQDIRFLEAPKPRRSVGHALGLAPMLQSLRPDLILTYGWGGTDGILAARISNYRRVIHAEDGFFPEEARKQKLSRLLARRILIRAAACVVCPSQSLVRIADESWHLPKNKITYIPNGIDTDRFSPASPEQRNRIRSRLGFHAGDVVIGTVGHLREEKNHERLIRAFARLPQETRLLIVGDGPLRQTLLYLVTELGLGERVTFTGVVTDAADHYRAMDIFVLSSDTEQMPMALLEAMSTQLPAVSTDVGDVKSMVSSSNASYVLPLGDEAAFGDALARLVQHPEIRATLAQVNRERCSREFHEARMISAYSELYNSALLG